ncbi:hypothetical protein ACFWGC_26995 [Cytobacillus pseudoceanisediminis]|uniref:hypothetical protein n=1 Tax=Cytobacillus pseudoceanisediminis TaxID=3051614 RepID=UPI0036473305
MFKLLINNKRWKDCSESNVEDILYIARTLSKFSHCRVDVYQNMHSADIKLSTFSHGKPIQVGIA